VTTDRPRSLTQPPPPPPAGPPGWERRLTAVEYVTGSLERMTAEKRHDHFMRWVVGVAIGVSVMALGMLAAWVIHLQSASASVHG
jgi:hypothetical protein